jgi:hypothetical protein
MNKVSIYGILTKTVTSLKVHFIILFPLYSPIGVSLITGVLRSPQPNLLPDVFCLMVRIFRLMLVLLYIHIYIVIIFLQL